jgi:hypothetical protein
MSRWTTPLANGQHLAVPMAYKALNSGCGVLAASGFKRWKGMGHG